MNPLRQIEPEVLALGREWTRLQLQKRLQAQCAALEMVCARTGQPLDNTRWRPLELATVVGKVALKARHGQCPQQQWICPARAAWGVEALRTKDAGTAGPTGLHRQRGGFLR